jgi:hypothetical protein
MKTIPICLLILCSQLVLAQKNQFANNPNLAAKGRFNAGAIITYSTATPPPAFIADVSYGISKKTTLGITGGTTGALALYGIKFNTLIAGSENKRLLFRFLSVYYPERDGRFMFDRKPKSVEPWFLSMAVIDGEWKLKNRMRLNVGIGLMENHCREDMKMWFKKDQEHHEMGVNGEMEESLIDVFTTLQAGVAFPLSQRLTLKFEAIAVFHKTRLIHKDEFKVTFPINPFLNFVYAF